MGGFLSGEQQETIIDLINEEQDVFYVSSEIIETSKNCLFIGFKRIFNKEDKNLYDKKKCFALKLIDYQKDKDIQDFERESNILDLFQDFPQIIKYEDKIKFELNGFNHLLISMKYYVHSDLFNYLWRSDFDFDEELIQKIAYQSLKILQLLKSRNVVHNDFKFENFIVESNKPLKLILTDFECSQILLPNEKSNIYTGTAVYDAPEVLRKEPHDYAADIWSLGANLYTTVFGKYPFEIDNKDNKQTIRSKVENNPLVNIDCIASKFCWECITRMLVLDPDDRITVEDAINLPWFEFIESDDIKSVVNNIHHEIIFGNEIRETS